MAVNDAGLEGAFDRVDGVYRCRWLIFKGNSYMPKQLVKRATLDHSPDLHQHVVLPPPRAFSCKTFVPSNVKQQVRENGDQFRQRLAVAFYASVVVPCDRGEAVMVVARGEDVPAEQGIRQCWRGKTFGTD